MNKPDLNLDFCSHAAAKYACEKWHYSGSVPPPPHVRIGAWENDSFIGVVLFGRGASSNLLKPYGLQPIEGAELVRVALRQHDSPVSRIVAIAVKMLRRRCPGLRLLVSFADPAQGHAGKIYQAMNWLYAGQSAASNAYRDKTGRIWHERMVSERGWNYVFGQKRKVVKASECERIRQPGKHRYLLPLDNDMRRQIESLRRPYPKADAQT